MAERLEVTATWRGGLATDVAAREHEVRVDEPAGAGGGDTGQMPTELFLSSLASCFCLALAWAAGKRGLELPGLAVTVSARRAGRELRYEHLVVDARADVDSDTMTTLLERARPLCWVSNTLAAGCNVEYVSTSSNARLR
jgi:putative redox protein